MTSSYRLPHAGASRHGRVATTLRIPSEAVEVAALPAGADPRFVLVSPEGDVLVDEVHRVLRLLPDGDGVSLSRAPRTVLEERWEGAFDFVSSRQARMLGYRVIDGHAYGVYQYHHSRAARDELVVEMFRIEPPPEGEPSGYTEHFGDLGVGALDERGGAWVVVGGRALALDPAGEPAAPPQDPARSDLGRARVLTERAVELANVYEASLLRAGFVAVGVDTCRSPPIERYFADVERLRGTADKRSWTSVVLCLDDALDERWRVPVPFAVRQPPVDGGPERVVVAGDALASLERGEIHWTHTFGFPCRVTSDADGTLAVTSGSELSFVDAAGKLRHRLQLDEAIVTPPAVDAAGDVWLATATKLYRTR